MMVLAGIVGIILDRSVGPKAMYPRLPIVIQGHAGVVFWLFYCPGQFRSQTHAQRYTVAGFSLQFGPLFSHGQVGVRC